MAKKKGRKARAEEARKADAAKVNKTADNKVTKTVDKKVVRTKRPNVSALTLGKNTELAFGKENYKWIGIGVACIALGMLLMMGGYNENPAVWDESGIYSMRRILLAPIVILIGLGIQIYAIFK